MSQATEERLAYVVEYYDELADVVRTYQLLFFLADNTIEMYDVKNRKVFLKRCKYPDVARDDLYLGNTVVVYSRHLRIAAYADDYTRALAEGSRERTLAMIKPDGYPNAGRIIAAIQQRDTGLTIANMRLVRLTRENAEAFYEAHRGREFYQNLVDFMTSGYVIAMELVGENAIAKWRQLIGPTSTSVARHDAPRSIRALYGTDNTRNAVHGSDSVENGLREIDFFFGGSVFFEPTATFEDCTCAVIRPHAIRDGLAGVLIDSILDNGFIVTALQMYHLDKKSAEEFIEVYKGVIPEYQGMLDELVSGPVLAMELRKDSDDVVGQFRELCGPADPAVGKVLRPHTLRAQHGKDKVKNAIHCTDLPGDGVLEVEYFFKLLNGV